MSELQIYKDEIEAGLGDILTSSENLSVAFYSQLRPVIDNLSLASSEQVEAFEKYLKVPNLTYDLYPLYSILVSTGWNENDDVFLKEHTFAAKDTPVNKPFNFEHDPTKIIGHITGSVVLDEDYNIIETNKLENVPDKFHICTGAVVYRQLKRNKELYEAIAELIQEINSGEWYVSMEALFSDFDYGLSNVNGDFSVLQRNEQTSYLTKHLRLYKGSGEYNGQKIGRVLKDITFSGKGLVKRPANPGSIIFNTEASKLSKLFLTISNVLTNKDDVVMSKENELGEQVAQLQKDLAEAHKALADADVKSLQSALSAKDAEIVELKKLVSDTEAKINTASELTVAAENAKTETEKQITELKDELTKANSELGLMKAEAKKQSRINLLIEKGVEKAVAEAVLVKFENVSDEIFAEIVEMQNQLVQAKKVETPKTEEVKVEETVVAEADIVNATIEPETTPNLPADDAGKEREAVIASLSEFIGTSILKTKKVEKE